MSTDGQSPPRSATPTIPLKRPLEDDHAPAISSPLNPNPAARSATGLAREQRSKKESLKKREAAESLTKGGSVDKGAKNSKRPGNAGTLAPSPTRYNNPVPNLAWQYQNKDLGYAACDPEPIFTPGTRIELLRPLDHPENRKNFRYMHCVGDTLFQHSRYFRQSDLAPYGPRMSRSDSDRNFFFDRDSCRLITNQKGWRLSRANVGAREGTFYYEVKIVEGIPADFTKEEVQTSPAPLPHVRAGWARREAPLDAPVGFDGYSYGITDSKIEPMHRSRASRFLDDGDDRAAAKKKSKKKPTGTVGSLANTTAFAADDIFRTGDVMGLSITLPPLSLHRKVADGTYNPAVDRGPGASSGIDADAAPNIVRDRIPIIFKGAMYFESLEYRATKQMDNYGDRGPALKKTPSPNHADASLRSLPGSSIKVWKNGKRIGTAFRDLMAFLPPCSQPIADKGVRLGQDDGYVGYFPAVSAFSSAIAEVNFGPDFWYPPEELSRTGADETSAAAGTDAQSSDVKQEDDVDVQMGGTEETAAAAAAAKQLAQKAPELRPMGLRYQEQIAEDVVYDIIDEVDFFVQDGGASGVDDAGAA